MQGLIRTSENPSSSLELQLSPLSTWDLVGYLGQENALRLQRQAIGHRICVEIVLESKVEQTGESSDITVSGTDADL